MRGRRRIPATRFARFQVGPGGPVLRAPRWRTENLALALCFLLPVSGLTEHGYCDWPRRCQAALAQCEIFGLGAFACQGNASAFRHEIGYQSEAMRHRFGNRVVGRKSPRWKGCFGATERICLVLCLVPSGSLCSPASDLSCLTVRMAQSRLIRLLWQFAWKPWLCACIAVSDEARGRFTPSPPRSFGILDSQAAFHRFHVADVPGDLYRPVDLLLRIDHTG